MPYIKHEDREVFDKIIDELVTIIKDKYKNDSLNGYALTLPGYLNYIITKLLKNVYREKMQYHSFNEIVGILECCKLEIYRHIIGRYEDSKISQNGDVE